MTENTPPAKPLVYLPAVKCPSCGDSLILSPTDFQVSQLRSIGEDWMNNFWALVWEKTEPKPRKAKD